MHTLSIARIGLESNILARVANAYLSYGQYIQRHDGKRRREVDEWIMNLL